MKRAMITLLLLLLVFSALTWAAASDIYETRDKVKIYENTRLGNPIAADGLSISLINTLNDHLFWTISGTSKKGKLDIETKYEFSRTQKIVSEENSYCGIKYNNALDPVKGFTKREISSLSGISLAYRELYDETPPGQSEQKEILLKDYFDYYPLEAKFDFPEDSFSIDTSYSYTGEDFYFTGSEDEKKIFNSNFKIPVLGDEKLIISLEKNRDGYVEHSGWSSAGTDSYNPVTITALTEDKCFFSLSMRSAEEKLVDYSQIKYGCGIYSFNYTMPALSSIGRHIPLIDPSSFCNAFPLAPETRVICMDTDKDNRWLYLLTEERARYIFYIIDLTDMTSFERFELSDAHQDGLYSCKIYDEESFITVMLNGTDKIAVISRCKGNGNTSFKLEFVSDFFPEAYAEYDADYADLGIEDENINAAFAFDGKRLAVAFAYDYYYSPKESSGYILLIITKDGPQYIGDYKTSLNVNSDHYSRDYNVRAVDNETLRLKWS